MNYLRMLFFGNVDKILDQFQNVIAKLDKAIELQNAKAVQAVQAQERARANELAANASAAKAAAARDNIKNLLGG